jgi:hypothetical protein
MSRFVSRRRSAAAISRGKKCKPNAFFTARSIRRGSRERPIRRSGTSYLALDLGEHGELRADERLFLVASCHVVEGVDEFVKKRDRYDLAALSQNR